MATEFTPNSHKFKEEQTKALPARDTERRAKKVVAGTARTKKKSELREIRLPQKPPKWTVFVHFTLNKMLYN